MLFSSELVSDAQFHILDSEINSQRQSKEAVVMTAFVDSRPKHHFTQPEQWFTQYNSPNYKKKISL